MASKAKKEEIEKEEIEIDAVEEQSIDFDKLNAICESIKSLPKIERQALSRLIFDDGELYHYIMGEV
jgi:hypothetical protein